MSLKSPIARNAFAALAALAAASLISAGAAAAACEPSKWGPDDEIGSANLVTPERVLMAAKLVKKGEAKPLGIVIDRDTPAFAPRSFALQVVQPGQQYGADAFGYPGVYNDDLVQMWLGVGSQIDGLSHLGYDGEYYNCNKGQDFAQITGVTKLGVHNVPPLVGRGVIVDMARHFDKPFLEAGFAFGAADVKAAMQDQGVEAKAGDIVLFHTGWTDAKLKSAPQEWGAGEPGILPDVAEMLAAADVMAVGADTWGLDVVPAPKGEKTFYGHVVLLKDHGIYILETMNTGPLVEEGVQEFMFVLGQARIRGTVQMVINPVALY